MRSKVQLSPHHFLHPISYTPFPTPPFRNFPYGNVSMHRLKGKQEGHHDCLTYELYCPSRRRLSPPQHTVTALRHHSDKVLNQHTVTTRSLTSLLFRTFLPIGSMNELIALSETNRKKGAACVPNPAKGIRKNKAIKPCYTHVRVAMLMK